MLYLNKFQVYLRQFNFAENCFLRKIFLQQFWIILLFSQIMNCIWREKLLFPTCFALTFCFRYALLFLCNHYLKPMLLRGEDPFPQRINMRRNSFNYISWYSQYVNVSWKVLLLSAIRYTFWLAIKFSGDTFLIHFWIVFSLKLLNFELTVIGS